MRRFINLFAGYALALMVPPRGIFDLAPPLLIERASLRGPSFSRGGLSTRVRVRSRYVPHQGARECARWRRQLGLAA